MGVRVGVGVLVGVLVRVGGIGVLVGVSVGELGQFVVLTTIERALLQPD